MHKNRKIVFFYIFAFKKAIFAKLLFFLHQRTPACLSLLETLVYHLGLVDKLLLRNNAKAFLDANWFLHLHLDHIQKLSLPASAALLPSMSPPWLLFLFVFMTIVLSGWTQATCATNPKIYTQSLKLLSNKRCINVTYQAHQVPGHCG